MKTVSWVSLASLLCFNEFQVSQRPCLRKQKWANPEEQYQSLTSGLCTHVCICFHITLQLHALEHTVGKPCRTPNSQAEATRSRASHTKDQAHVTVTRHRQVTFTSFPSPPYPTEPQQGRREDRKAEWKADPGTATSQASHLQVLLKSLCYDNGHSIALKA